MDGQLTIRQILVQRLEETRFKNPAFSLRAFARRLGIAPPMLSEIMNGKRRVTASTATRIVEKLCLDPETSSKILAAITGSNFAFNKLEATEHAKVTQLDMEHFRVISDWYHFAILSLAETNGFSGNPKQVAQRLGIPIKDAKAALARLLSLEMLERGKNGRLQATGVQYTTSDEIKNLSLRKSHIQDLELARRSLEQDELERRDFTAITMAINPRKLPEAKMLIREFRDRLCAFLEQDPKKEVYKMSIQLFPLTKEGDFKNETANSL